MIQVGVVGFGYWGPNFARVFHSLSGCDLVGICDTRPEARASAEKLYPGVSVVPDLDDLLEMGIDAAVVATPASTHCEVAGRLLDEGVDVLVEKPLAMSVAEGRLLRTKAETHRRVLMVGHLLEYHPGLVAFRDTVRSGELGDLYYLYCTRLNLGKVRAAESALWDLAPHDVSIIRFLTDARPISVSAQGGSYLRPGLEDVVFATIRFEGGIVAHLHVSWLDPHKVRRITVVGSRRMAVFDDMEPSEKVRIIDKGIDTTEYYESFQDAITERVGDVRIPPVPTGEPLKFEALHFLDCVLDRSKPRTDADNGLRVLEVLEGIERSIANDGSASAIGGDA
ncbi:MAG: Gfo/Idh/MocA family oxidoreductase [Gemmatimonadota bacterium]|nr:Gfo/Idh/MocA family oxidoreductase [Gemmatimonadota bacterium]MDP6803091.1 Gfo/Idh/MocA family oxidoreductase [Gemmatimonadota bacterium]MDP7031870.1 Gfo/Idh/MocA family oxidoreductase [Gemmatimonadota bacterium]